MGTRPDREDEQPGVLQDDERTERHRWDEPPPDESDPVNTARLSKYINDGNRAVITLIVLRALGAAVNKRGYKLQLVRALGAVRRHDLPVAEASREGGWLTGDLANPADPHATGIEGPNELEMKAIEARARLTPGYQGPRIDDARRLEAIWLADDLIEHISDLRDDLVYNRDTTFDDNVRVALTNAEIIVGELRSNPRLNDDGRTKVKRTFVLNVLHAVVLLRLPEVLTRLAANSRLTNTDILAIGAGAAEYTTLMVAARYPVIGAALRDNQDLLVGAVDVICAHQMGAGEQKWESIVDLMCEIDLWPEPKTDDDRIHSRESVRINWIQHGGHYIGDLADEVVRMGVWRQIAEFAAAIGMGNVDAHEFANAWADLRNDR